MKLIPAIDLKDGKCVRLSKGKQDSLVVFNNDPIKQAKIFEKEGCERIHIIDLDAVFGKKPDNKYHILNIRKEISIDIELGGGIRSEKDISFWIEKGINFLIIGSMAIKQPGLIKRLASKFHDKLYISIDDLNGKVMIEGWEQKSNLLTEQVLINYNSSKIRGFVFTDISRDGMMTGINIKKVLSVLKLAKKPCIIGGGLSNNNDLRNLSKLKQPLLEGIIAGKSYYLGKINIKTAKSILNQNA